MRVFDSVFSRLATQADINLFRMEIRKMEQRILFRLTVVTVVSIAISLAFVKLL